MKTLFIPSPFKILFIFGIYFLFGLAPAQLHSQIKKLDNIDNILAYPLLVGSSLSPDENYLIAGSPLILWDLRTDKIKYIIKDTLGFSDCSWSKDSKTIYVKSYDKYWSIIDAATGNVIKTLKQGLLSPDKKYVAVINNESIIIQDAITGNIIREIIINENNIYSYLTCWSPDGTKITSFNQKSWKIPDTLNIWDAKTGEIFYKKIINIPSYTLKKITWFNESSKLAIYYYIYDSTIYNEICIVDLKKGTEQNIDVISSKSKGDFIDDIIWSIDGNKIACICWDSTIKIYDVNKCKLVKEIFTTLDSRAVRWNPNGTFAYFSANKKVIEILNTNNWSVIEAIKLDRFFPCQFLQFNDDWTEIVYYKDNEIIISNLYALDIYDKLQYNEMESVEVLKFCPDGKRIAALIDNDKLTIFHNNNKILSENYFSYCYNSDFDWNPDGSLLAIGTTFQSVTNTFVLFWDSSFSDQYKKQLSFFMAIRGINSVSWNPDGNKIVVGGGQNPRDASQFMFYIWNIDWNNTMIKTSTYGHESEIMTFRWSPDGSKIASKEKEGKIKIWDAENSQELISFTGINLSNRLNNTISWSKDGKYLASIDSQDTIIIWDVDSGTEYKRFAGYNFSSLSWCPDGSMLAFGAKDSILIFNTQNWQLIKTLYTILPCFETLVAWSADSKKLAVGERGFIRIWDIEPTSVENEKIKSKSDISLKIEPNPVEELANITINISKNKFIDVKVISLSGITINSIYKGIIEPGEHTFTINTKDFTVGIYFVTIQTLEGTTSGKFVVF